VNLDSWGMRFWFISWISPAIFLIAKGRSFVLDSFVEHSEVVVGRNYYINVSIPPLRPFLTELSCGVIDHM
jgi:hypothetical protein